MVQNDAKGFRIGLPSPAAKSPEAEAVAPTIATSPTLPPTSPRTSVPIGCKSLTFYPSRDAWVQVRMLAAREGRTAYDLMLEALDDLLIKRNLTPNARVLQQDPS